MKRPIIITAGLLLTLGLMSGAAFAHEEWEEGFEHGHVLLLGFNVEIDEEAGTETITFRRCVDLAGGKALAKPNHHTKVHTGRAGQALYENAGHAVVPTFPLTPFANCAELAEMFGDPPIVIPLDEE